MPGLLAPLPKPRMKKLVCAERLALADDQRRHDRLQVLEVADLGALDGFGRSHGNRDRHFLQCLFPLGRGDDDLVAAPALRCGRLTVGTTLILRQSGGGMKRGDRSSTQEESTHETGFAGKDINH